MKQKNHRRGAFNAQHVHPRQRKRNKMGRAAKLTLHVSRPSFTHLVYRHIIVSHLEFSRRIITNRGSSCKEGKYGHEEHNWRFGQTTTSPGTINGRIAGAGALKILAWRHKAERRVSKQTQQHGQAHAPLEISRIGSSPTPRP